MVTTKDLIAFLEKYTIFSYNSVFDHRRYSMFYPEYRSHHSDEPFVFLFTKNLYWILPADEYPKHLIENIFKIRKVILN